MLKLDSPIWHKEKRRPAFSSVASGSARVMAVATRRRMVESKPTGKVYDRAERGSGFVRRHRASARGQRPALLSGTLANKAVKHERTGEQSAKCFVDERVAPYAERLQTKMGRQIVNNDDRRIARAEFNNRARNAVKSLL
jgi:hypothetical protein